MPTEDEELRDLIAEEKSRGTKRRRLDITARKKQAQLEKYALAAIKAGDLNAYVRMLHEAGMKEDSPEFANALRIFHSFQRPR